MLLPRLPLILKKSFSDLEYAAKKKLTRRDRFLTEIDRVSPSKLHKVVEPFYPKVEGGERPPIGLACMLHMHLAQQCFGLLDEGIEGGLCRVIDQTAEFSCKSTDPLKLDGPFLIV